MSKPIALVCRQTRSTLQIRNAIELIRCRIYRASAYPGKWQERPGAEMRDLIGSFVLFTIVCRHCTRPGSENKAHPTKVNPNVICKAHAQPPGTITSADPSERNVPAAFNECWTEGESRDRETSISRRCCKGRALKKKFSRWWASRVLHSIRIERLI